MTIQRWISDQQRDIVEKLLKPVTEQNRSWLIYAIDDAMHYDEIPLFNRGRQAFANDRIQDNIRYMLNVSDLVVVTTDHIKQYYHEKYGVPLQNIVAVPNLLPRWWFGDRFDPMRKVEQFGKFHKKPRIGIISSLSHYNIDGFRLSKDGKACRLVNDEQGNPTWKDQDDKDVKFEDTMEIQDDLDLICDMIRKTVNDFQWVFFGYAPPKLTDLTQAKKIEVYPGVPILNYPSQIEHLQLQAVVAPIIDMEFNRCKSHIKYLECCASGIPLFASNMLPYSNVMKREYLFDDAAELEKKLRKLKSSNSGTYRKIIDDNWRWLNSPMRDGDFNIKNGWLEDNINIWVDMFRLKSKAPTCSLRLYCEQRERLEKERQENLLFQGENGVEILK